MTAVHPVPRPLRGRRCAWIAAAPYPLWRAFSPPHLVERAAALLQSTSAWAALRSSEEAAVSASSSSSNSGSNTDVHARSYTAGSNSSSPSPTHAGDGTEGIPAATAAASSSSSANSSSANSSSSSSSANCSTSPTQFSFWLAASLPLGDTTRHSLLAMDSVVQRLRACVEHLERAARLPLRCAACGLRIALQADVFSVPGAEGSVGAYVNSAGFVHQTITLRAARGLRLDTSEPPSTADRCVHFAYCTLYCKLCFVTALCNHV
jgi:hypothetical protein